MVQRREGPTDWIVEVFHEILRALDSIKCRRVITVEEHAYCCDNAAVPKVRFLARWTLHGDGARLTTGFSDLPKKCLPTWEGSMRRLTLKLAK